MNRRLASLLVLALPLAGLAGLWASTEHWHRQGTDWLVPVTGYDPRDLLRGHYVEFRYAWPGAEESGLVPRELALPEQGEPAPPTDFPFGACIRGQAPAIAQVERLVSEADRAACPNAVAPDPAARSGYPDLPRDGRLYIPQTAGPELEAQLRDPDVQGMIRVRLRPDGTLTPLELTFSPRPPAPPDRADSRSP
ncbi:MAG: GDYXXLXY domain-containing protein [Sphingomonadaceae bacterium]